MKELAFGCPNPPRAEVRRSTQKMIKINDVEVFLKVKVQPSFEGLPQGGGVSLLIDLGLC